jgi:hypothetical protein
MKVPDIRNGKGTQKKNNCNIQPRKTRAKFFIEDGKSNPTTK